MNFKRKGRRNKGITLIALVITIIVLLILAGVTIMMLMGSENAPQKASEAVEKDAIAGAKDEVAMEAQSAILDYFNKKYVEGNGTEEKNIQEVVSEAASTAVENAKTRNNQLLNSSGVNEDYTITLETKSYTVTGTIEENGSITWGDIVASTEKNTETEVLTAEQIAQNPSENFGKVVTGYECKSTAVKEWKIFYADNDNIYLIASDYLNYNDIPKGRNGTKVGIGYDDYTVYLYYDSGENYGPVLNDYTGSGDIVNNEIKKLNSIYYNYLEEKEETDERDSAKEMAYLLDENVWSDFKGTNADFAVGCPTLELFIKSYNEKYKASLKTRVNESIKYEISYDDGSEFSYGKSKRIDNIYNDPLYHVDKGYAIQMLLASVSGDYEQGDDTTGFGLFVVGNYGVYGYYDQDCCGLRPVVRLSSNVKLITNGENFEIVK